MLNAARSSQPGARAPTSSPSAAAGTPDAAPTESPLPADGNTPLPPAMAGPGDRRGAAAFAERASREIKQLLRDDDGDRDDGEQGGLRGAAAGGTADRPDDDDDGDAAALGRAALRWLSRDENRLGLMTALAAALEPNGPGAGTRGGGSGGGSSGVAATDDRDDGGASVIYAVGNILQAATNGTDWRSGPNAALIGLARGLLRVRMLHSAAAALALRNHEAERALRSEAAAAAVGPASAASAGEPADTADTAAAVAASAAAITANTGVHAAFAVTNAPAATAADSTAAAAAGTKTPNAQPAAANTAHGAAVGDSGPENDGGDSHRGSGPSGSALPYWEPLLAQWALLAGLLMVSLRLVDNFQAAEMRREWLSYIRELSNSLRDSGSLEHGARGVLLAMRVSMTEGEEAGAGLPAAATDAEPAVAAEASMAEGEPQVAPAAGPPAAVGMEAVAAADAAAAVACPAAAMEAAAAAGSRTAAAATLEATAAHSATPAAAAAAAVRATAMATAPELAAPDGPPGGQQPEDSDVLGTADTEDLTRKDFDGFCMCIFYLIQLRASCVDGLLTAAAAALDAALRGPCLRFAVLARGLAALGHIDGGPVYGLPPAVRSRLSAPPLQLPPPPPSGGEGSRPPDAAAATAAAAAAAAADAAGVNAEDDADVAIRHHMDDAVLAMACFLSQAHVLGPPPSRRESVRVLLRISRVALAACRRMAAELEARRRPRRQATAMTHGSEEPQSSQQGCAGGGSGGGATLRDAGPAAAATASARGGGGGGGGGARGDPPSVTQVANLARSEGSQSAAASNSIGAPPLYCAMAALLGAQNVLEPCRAAAAAQSESWRAAAAERWRLAVEAVGYVRPELDAVYSSSDRLSAQLLRLGSWQPLNQGPRPPLPLPPQPPADVSAALDAGLLPCLERLIRRAADKDTPVPQAAGHAHGEADEHTADTAEHILGDALRPDPDAPPTYPIVPLLCYGEPRQAAALVTSVGKAARRRWTRLVSDGRTMSEVLVRHAAAVLIGGSGGGSSGGGGGGGGCGRGGGNRGADGSSAARTAANNTRNAGTSGQLIFDMDHCTYLSHAVALHPAAALLLRDGPAWLAAAASADAVNGNAGAAAAAVGDDPGAHAPPPPPPLPPSPQRRLALALSLAAQRWLPDLVGPVAWAAKNLGCSAEVLDLLTLLLGDGPVGQQEALLDESVGRQAVLRMVPLSWVHLLALGEERDVVAVAETSSGGGGGRGNGDWRRRALQQLGAVQLLGLELRLAADGRWRRRLGLTAAAEAEAPRLALLADCLCRVAAVLPEEVRAAATEATAGTAAAARAAPQGHTLGVDSEGAFCLTLALAGAAGVKQHTAASGGLFKALAASPGLFRAFEQRCGAAPNNDAVEASRRQQRTVRGRRGRGGGRGRGAPAAVAADGGEDDDGSAPLSYWPPGLLRNLAGQLQDLNMQPSAVAVQTLAAQLATAGSAAAPPPMPTPMPVAGEVMAAARSLLPPEAVRLVLRTCDQPGCVNVVGDSEAGLARLMCGRCGGAWYCGRACQMAHWRETHRHTCGRGGQKPPTPCAAPSAESAPEEATL